MVKYAGFAFMVIGAILSVALYMTGHLTVPLPIDQSKCPPNVGIAPDGTCGIYTGSKLSLWTTLSIISGIVGVLLYVTGWFLERKNAIK